MTTPESPFGPWEPYKMKWDIDGETVWACYILVEFESRGFSGDIFVHEPPMYIVFHEGCELEPVPPDQFKSLYARLPDYNYAEVRDLADA